MVDSTPLAAGLRVLVVDDNPDILANLHGYLEPLGYKVDSARDGIAGLEAAGGRRHDAIVLDLMLPGLDGIEVCRRLQALRNDIPVLMLTARDTVDDRILGLNSGADDYLVKPFSLHELHARLQALVRRSRGRLTAALQVGSLRFDPATLEVTREGKRLEFSPMGYRILGALMRASPAVVTRQMLEHELWGDEPPSSDALRTHIHAVRQVLEKPFTRSMLVTIPAVGYRLLDPDAT